MSDTHFWCAVSLVCVCIDALGVNWGSPHRTCVLLGVGLSCNFVGVGGWQDWLDVWHTALPKKLGLLLQDKNCGQILNLLCMFIILEGISAGFATDVERHTASFQTYQHRAKKTICASGC